MTIRFADPAALAWLDAQPNASAAIREAVRFYLSVGPTFDALCEHIAALRDEMAQAQWGALPSIHGLPNESNRVRNRTHLPSEAAARSPFVAPPDIAAAIDQILSL